jgi:predicted component of type VI protein secretion system
MSWLALGTLTRELRDGEAVVGSGADADWRVPTADLMPRHFTLTVHGLNASIRPSTPDAVVVVNDLQLTGAYHLLNDGDVVAAGRGQFIFTDDAPAPVDDDPPDAPLDEAYLIDEQRKVAYRLQNRSTTLGRDVSNGIVVRDPRASRFHAEVRREAGGFALHTMGSAGTSLNGEAMRSPRVLQEGDSIEIAFGAFRFTEHALPDGISLDATGLGMNDEAAVQPTAVGPRATLESAVRATEPPRPVMSIKVVIGIAAIVIAALAIRFFARP